MDLFIKERTKKTRNTGSCKYRYFNKGEDLAYFINENNITGDKIISIVNMNNQVWLYYWK